MEIVPPCCGARLFIREISSSPFAVRASPLRWEYRAVGYISMVGPSAPPIMPILTYHFHPIRLSPSGHLPIRLSGVLFALPQAVRITEPAVAAKSAAGMVVPFRGAGSLRVVPLWNARYE